MAEVARLGFERFANDLEKAWHGGRPSPLEALQSVGRAYLAFARNEPAYYAAMFETGLPKALNAGLREVLPTGRSMRSMPPQRSSSRNFPRTAARPARWLRCTSGRCRTVSPRSSDAGMRKRDRRSRRKSFWRLACFFTFAGWVWRAELRRLPHFDIYIERAAYMVSLKTGASSRGLLLALSFFAVGKRQSRPRKCHLGRVQALSGIVTNEAFTFLRSRLALRLTGMTSATISTRPGARPSRRGGIDRARSRSELCRRISDRGASRQARVHRR